MKDSIKLELKTNFIFHNRPESLPPDLRPIWRITIVLLFLKIACKGNRSSFKKMHVLNWVIKSEIRQKQLLNFLNDSKQKTKIEIRIEPSLNRAVDLAHGEGLVVRTNSGQLKITKHGLNFVDLVQNSKQIFISEILFLEKIGNKLTDSKINEIMSKRV